MDADFAAGVREALPPNVSFVFRGAVPNEVVMEHYRSTRVDLLVNVSDSEGIPVSIMEAMSFGIPAAATPVGGTPELVQDAFNGYLLDKKDVPHSLSSVIERIAAMTDDDLTTLRSRARATWEQSFNAETNYPVFYDTIWRIGAETG